MTNNDDSKFTKVVDSVEKTISITAGIVNKLEMTQSVDPKEIKKIVNACLNIASELKSIPFSLTEIEKILIDIVSSIHANRKDLEESINILIQSTGHQLTKVTDATAEATNNIMDITDHLVENQNSVTADLMSLKDMIKDEKANEIFDKLIATIQEDQSSIYQIWDFLQFQDITTQQIEYAYNLLREAESKLVKISDRLSGLDSVEMKVIEEHNAAFDPDADFDFKGDRQESIDDLLKQFGK